MKAPKILCSIAALAFSLTASQAVETDPVGFVSVTVPANSDAILAVPMARASEFKGVISAISGTSGTVTLTVSGTPAWTTNANPTLSQFAPLATLGKTYVVQIASGTKEGLILPVITNGTNTVTVSVGADDLTGVPTGTDLDIFPMWTPKSLITSVVAQDSQILLLKSTQAGVNLSSSGAYVFDTTGWVDDNFDSADNAPLDFGSAFIFRNGGASTTISMVGAVPMTKHRAVLRTRANNVDQDVAIGFTSPVPTPVGSLGLNFASDDQILIFNNSAPGQNKSSTAALVYDSTLGWLDDNFDPVNTTFMIQPGQGYIFRKKGTATPQSIVWTALQTYLQ